MPEEQGLLKFIKAAPDAELPRLVDADWLDDRDDPRGDFIRLHWALVAAAPDHIDRFAGEEELSFLRMGCEAEWLAVIEPEAIPKENPTWHVFCQCYTYPGLKNSTHYFHGNIQNTECDAWKRILDLVEDAAAIGREAFSPLLGMTDQDRSQILTLPLTIAKLKTVKRLNLYGSHLVRLPPEIGEMTSLDGIDTYTSYKLHWYPYELTRCPNLRGSRVSTRAIYGNYKHRPPFPRLTVQAPTAPRRVEPKNLPLKQRTPSTARTCSVCRRQFEDLRLHRVWISLRVATDVLPLLVNACSEECVSRLPKPPEDYFPIPHKGGQNLKQPPPR